MNTTNDYLQKLRTYKAAKASVYGISRIGIFGSVARGDDHEESDIDILIISNHREDIDDIISEEIAWIMYDKQELISAHVINEDLFNKTKNFSFLTNVLKDGVPIG